jgi:beta-galactosidase GanA
VVGQCIANFLVEKTSVNKEIEEMKKENVVWMKRVSSFSLTCIFVFGLLSFQTTGAENILPNARIDNVEKENIWGIEGWSPVGNEGCELDTKTSHSGKYSLKIEKTSPNQNGFWRTSGQIPVSEGEKYRIGCWIKTENVIPGEKRWYTARVTWEAYNKKGKRCDWGDIDSVSGTTDWHYVERVITIPEKPRKYPDVPVETLRLALHLTNAVGTVWFDDFVVEPVKATKEPVEETKKSESPKEPIDATFLAFQLEQINEELKNLKSEVVQWKQQPEWFWNWYDIADRYLQLAWKDFQEGNSQRLTDTLSFLEREIHYTTSGLLCAERNTPGSKISLKNNTCYVDGEPEIMIGTLGWWELARDIGRMKEYGFNIIGGHPVHFGPESLKKIARENLKMVLSLYPTQLFAPTHSPPSRLGDVQDFHYDGYPAQLKRKVKHRTLPGYYWHGFMRDRKGNLLNVDHPASREQFAQLIHKEMNKIKGIPVFLVDMHNEWGYMDYSDISVEWFRRWSEKKYNNIANANNAWGTEYGSFKQVSPPLVYVSKQGMEFKGNNKNRALLADWFRFNWWRCSEYFRWYRSAIKREDPNQYVTLKITAMSISPRTVLYGNKYDELAKHQDILGPDSKFFLNDEYEPEYRYSLLGQYYWDAVRTAAGEKPVIDTEYHVSDPGQNTEFVKALLWEPLMHGINMQLIWVWWANDDPEKFGGFLSEKRWPETAIQTLKNSIKKIQSLKSIITPVEIDTKIAILFSHTTNLFLPEEKYKSGEEWAGGHLRESKSFYEACMFSGIPVDILAEDLIKQGRLEDYDFLLLPSVEAVGNETIGSIKKWTEKGGTVLATVGFGKKDVNGQARSYPPEMFGVKTVKKLKDQNRAEVKCRQSVQDIQSLSQSTDFEQISCNTAVPVIWNGSHPLLTHKKMGEGILYYLSANLTPRGYQTIILHLLPANYRTVTLKNDAGKESWGIEYRVIDRGKQKLIYMLNFQNDRKNIRLRTVFNLNDYEIVDVYQDKVLKPTGKSLMLAFDPGEVKVLLLEG